MKTENPTATAPAVKTDTAGLNSTSLPHRRKEQTNDHLRPPLLQRLRLNLRRRHRRHTCPDCGTPNALTDEEKRRGYHCSRCTQVIEEGF